jgi:hypothetical protein
MNLCSGLRLTDLHTNLKMFKTDLLGDLPLVGDGVAYSFDAISARQSPATSTIRKLR